MRFMMLVFPEGYDEAEPGTVPDDAEAVRKMMEGYRVSYSGGKPTVTDGVGRSGQPGRLAHDRGQAPGPGSPPARPAHRREAPGDRPGAGGRGHRGGAPRRGVARARGGRHAPARLHVLPSRAVTRGQGRPDPAPAGRSDHRGDRPGLPGARPHAGPAHRHVRRGSDPAGAVPGRPSPRPDPCRARAPGARGPRVGLPHGDPGLPGGARWSRDPPAGPGSGPVGPAPHPAWARRPEAGPGALGGSGGREEAGRLSPPARRLSGATPAISRLSPPPGPPSSPAPRAGCAGATR